MRVRWILILLFLFIIAAAGLIWAGSRGQKRQSIVLASSTITVFSYESSRGARVILLPKEGVIEGIHGYGRYSLEGLWKLGIIEKKDGNLLRESLEESLALPIANYLGQKELPDKDSVDNPLVSLKQYFNITQLPAFISGYWQTNLSLPSYIALSNLIKSLPPHKIEVFDFRNSNVFTPEELPDGTTRRVFDADRFDYEIGTEFEEENFRSGGLTVAIYNTTQVPLLGSGAARLLSHLGVRVVLVANDTPKIEKCELLVQTQYLQTDLADFIKKQYDCGLIEAKEAGRANLILRLGSAYEEKFKKK